MLRRPVVRPYLCAAALALTALAAAAPAAEAQRRAADALPVDSMVRMGVLPNGMRFYVRANPEPRGRAELRLAVDAGSVLEDADQRGVAHFLEHMAFNGTERFPRQSLVNYLERVGMRFGPDVNAYTSFDETVYMLTLPTDSVGVLETGVRVLEDWASAIQLDSLEVERERGVVIEEWRLRQSAAGRLQKQQFPVLMQRSRYAQRDPIGTLESLQTFSHDALRRFYRDWYRPDLMAVVAVGDFHPDSMEQLIRRELSDVPRPPRPRPRREFTVPEHRETLVSVATDPEATGSTVSLYLKRVPRPWETASAYRAWIVESLASSMLTNRLSEMTQRPASPLLDVSSFQGRFIRPLAAYVLSARVPDGGVERGMEALLQETERAARHGFTATELEREQREMLRMMEQRYAERDKTTSSSYAADYVSHFLYGGTPVALDQEFELYRRFVPQITLAEVNAQARRWMRGRNRVVLVTAPERPDVAVPEADRLRRTLAAVARRPLEPYTDSLSAAPLLRNPPAGGRIVAQREVPEVGVTEWTLDNGVRVLLKPTDFRDDEILLAARSPGGTSLVPDADYLAALTASAVVQAGGVGELSSIELRKRLAGRVAGVGADIGELYEGLSGAASPQDLETLFQLVYLKFVAPRADSAAFAAYREQARASLENRAASPEVAFADTLRGVLTQHHPRARPLRSEMFDSLDMRRSFQIYRDRFADASDFTFYVVGTFEPDSVRPLVERYLGSLPSLGRTEQGRDLGVRPPRGVVRRVVRRGLEPRALTQLVFTGGFEFGRENLYTLNALAEVLRIRLREVLREDMGGTYGVEVRGGGAGAPWPHYQFTIGFGADPARVDELTAAVFAQLDSLRRHGATEDEVLKVREMQTRARQLEMRRNHFWISQIMSYHRNGWELPDILDFDRWVAGLTPAQIREAAARYLDTANYVHVTLLPEDAAPGAAAPSEAGGTELPSGRGIVQ